MERIIDATTFIAVDDSIGTTSSDYHSLTITGDTLQLYTLRTPASSSATGNQGEWCWGSETLLCITSHYIFVCVGANTWKRTLLSTF
jgi:hypothetical protein